MIYLDTSLVVAAITAETDTARIQKWMKERQEAQLCVSDWVVAEVAGALAFKLRTGQIDESERRAALLRWTSMRQTLLAIEPITSDAFQAAADLFDSPLVKLRSGDALHMGIAKIGGHSLATLDKAMASAAKDLGILVEDLGER